jgi:hypothetical protein
VERRRLNLISIVISTSKISDDSPLNKTPAWVKEEYRKPFGCQAKLFETFTFFVFRGVACERFKRVKRSSPVGSITNAFEFAKRNGVHIECRESPDVHAERPITST